MTKIAELTTSQLNSIIAIREEIERLQGQIDSIVGGADAPAAGKETRKRRMSAAARARISAGAKARWAKVKGAGTKTAKKAKRRLSAEGRAAIIAGTKARWAKWAGETGASATPKVAKKDRRSSPAVRAKLAAAAKARWAKAKAAGKSKL